MQQDVCKHGLPLKCDCYICGLQADNERLREALRSIMHVSAWDGIAYELDRCYTLAKEALRK